MLTRRLGKSGLEVSALGMGCWAIGGPWTWAQPGEEPFAAGWGQIDDKESIRAIYAALDAGVNLFDTAANYGAGHSERILGRALMGRRHQVVIATKCGFDPAPARRLRDVLESLVREGKIRKDPLNKGILTGKFTPVSRQ